MLEFGRLVWFLGLGVRFLDIGFSAKNPMWPQSVPVLLLPRDSLWASLFSLHDLSAAGPERDFDTHYPNGLQCAGALCTLPAPPYA